MRTAAATSFNSTRRFLGRVRRRLDLHLHDRPDPGRPRAAHRAGHPAGDLRSSARCAPPAARPTVPVADPRPPPRRGHRHALAAPRPPIRSIHVARSRPQRSQLDGSAAASPTSTGRRTFSALALLAERAGDTVEIDLRQTDDEAEMIR